MIGDTKPSEAKEFSPPYNISWATFLNTIDKIAGEMPTRVDRTYLDSQAGSVQTYLISALRGFGFIDGDQRTDTENMKGWASAVPEARPGFMAELLRRYYPSMIELGTSNSTPGELADAFAEAFPAIAGESRTKAVRFFLSAAAYAGVQTSPMWKAVKAPRGTSRKAGARSRKAGTSGGGEKPPEPKPSTSPDAMKKAYFDLLLQKAGESEQVDTDLLDRIERLVGLDGKV